MNNKTTSTNYIALQPPYKIIKHGLKIGVQIGTQVLTITNFKPLSIETHNYPVVIAEDRIDALKEKDFHVDGSCDSEIWDNVEAKQVSVLCEAGVCLTWQQFIKILWHDHARLADPRLPIKKVRIFKKLLKYNKSMMLPSPGLYDIHLQIESSAGNKPCVVRSSEDDVFALNVEWTENLKELENRLVLDLKEYMPIISPNRSTNFWHMHYETNEERLLPLVERLNTNNNATSFRNTAMASFVVTAITPYEEDNAQKEAQQIPDEKHGEHYFGKDVKIFHLNLDTNKIAQAISKLDRNKGGNKQIAVRNFCLILYKVFSRHSGCLTTNKRTFFLDWIKFNCKLYFESNDLKKVKLDCEEKQKVEEYHALFADKQPNGIWYFKKQYYKTDNFGKPLQSIDGLSW